MPAQNQLTDMESKPKIIMLSPEAHASLKTDAAVRVRNSVLSTIASAWGAAFVTWCLSEPGKYEASTVMVLAGTCGGLLAAAFIGLFFLARRAMAHRVFVVDDEAVTLHHPGKEKMTYRWVDLRDVSMKSDGAHLTFFNGSRLHLSFGAAIGFSQDGPLLTAAVNAAGPDSILSKAIEKESKRRLRRQKYAFWQRWQKE